MVPGDFGLLEPVPQLIAPFGGIDLPGLEARRRDVELLDPLGDEEADA
jgi:hypothetical protein